MPHEAISIREKDLGAKPRARSKAYFRGIHLRFQLNLLASILAPLIVLAVYFNYQLNTTLKESGKVHLLGLAASQRNTIELFLEERVVNLFSLFYSMDFSVTPTRKDMEGHLQSLKRASKAFIDVGFFDSEGLHVGYAGPHSYLEGKDYSGESWFSVLIAEEKRFHLSDVYLGFRNKPHFSIAVKQTIDEKFYVFRATLDPDRFYQYLHGIPHEEKGVDAALINKDGFYQVVNPARGELFDKSEYLPEGDKEYDVKEIKVEGEAFVLAYAWLKEIPWALTIRQPLSLAYAEMRRARIVVLSSTLLIVLGVVWLVWVSSDRLLRRAEATAESREELQSELLHAAKLASVGQLAAGVAHEINNPLAIIVATTGVVRDMLDPELKVDWDDTEVVEELDTIDNAVFRAQGITSQLMNFSRKNIAQLVACNVNKILDDVVGGFIEHELRVSGIQIERKYDDNLPNLQLDVDQISQVFINLINNAADAIEDKGSIILTTEHGDDGFIKISVEDTGDGIPPEELQTIFLPFFTTKEVGKGTGLGLSVSLSIVESMGGRMEVKSVIGRGSAFAVILPIPGETEGKA